jgi:hypothetical protein
MPRHLLIALALTLCVPCGAATASPPNPSTGNGLLAVCESLGAGWELGLCYGYIAGVSDIARDLRIVCYPPDVTNRQIIDVVLTGLRSSPAERHKSSDSLATKYLAAAFPCPTSTGGR